ncbi:hypothetical protein [Allorhizocola rhizosphaerae]|uniref:hypothetical protein n=1 Tax=Allorhizocola rhizosphaerae TaxID=1872709 RepID=UPI0013C37689|nr:hypothetical protein [Allorhizocola rhizosphaerae]
MVPDQRLRPVEENPAQTGVAGHEALDIAADLSNARATTFVDRLVGDLRPWRSEPVVKTLSNAPGWLPAADAPMGHRRQQAHHRGRADNFTVGDALRHTPAN